MHDLTRGSIAKSIARMTMMMFVSMVLQTLYLLLDLYFVGRLGSHAVAAVSLVGNLSFLVMAVTQVLGVGTTTLVAHATGVKDRDLATTMFNQSQIMSIVVGMLFVAVLFALRPTYAAALSADAETGRLASEYLAWFIPALGLQFPLLANAAALRGTGNFLPGVAVQSGSVLLNMVLAPALIFGWVTGKPLGVAGAGIATFIAVAIGLAIITAYVRRDGSYLSFALQKSSPRLSVWWQLLKVGLPAGGEFALLSAYLVVVYVIIRPFGSTAQAGFGVGLRVGQAAMLPALALGLAVAPLAGQNFAAAKSARVRETLRVAAWMSVALMGTAAFVCYLARDRVVHPFSDEPKVLAVASEYIAISCLMYVPTGLNFVASSVFQGIGNTLPSLFSSTTRTLLLTVPACLLSRVAGFELRWIWYLAVTTTVLQAALNFLLLNRELARRLPNEQPAEASARVAIEAAQ